jgi:hypothetical protein
VAVQGRIKVKNRAHPAMERVIKLATTAYGLLPRDVFISVATATPGNLEPDKWRGRYHSQTQSLF